MRTGHHAAATPCAVGLMWVCVAVGALGDIPLLVRLVVLLVMTFLVRYSSAWPDFDQLTSSISNDIPLVSQVVSRLVRFVSWRVHVATRTSKDKVKPHGDCHRDFTHTIEGCALFGGTVWAGTAPIPFVGVFAFWWGLAVFTGCVSHMLADSLTPSGVPLSLIVNLLLRRGAWVRYCVGYRMVTLWSFRPGKRISSTLAVPLLWVGRVVSGKPRSTHHRGVFTTNTAEERRYAVPAMYGLAVFMFLSALGLWSTLADVSGLSGWVAGLLA